MSRRVSITGIGVVSPLGHRLEEFKLNLLEGASGAALITAFDPAQLPTRIAAEVDAETLPEQSKDRKIAFGTAAARFAIGDARLFGKDPAEHYPARCGALSLGIGLELFSMPDMVTFMETEGSSTSSEMDRLTFLQSPSDICLHMICREHELGRPPMTHISACAASTDAIGLAFRMIRDGERDWMLAGGTDSMINPMGVAGFCKIGATTTRNEEPRKASRPFDVDRDGFLLGEGACVFLLEPRDRAEARGARIYADITGYGNSFDAHGISEPHPEGEGAFLSMQRALDDSAIRPEEISYVNAHGTSTPKNDPIETKAIRRLLGAHADRVPVSSTKSMIGHLISAAGAVELAASIVCARDGFIHPTINLEKRDPGCDLDYVEEGARESEVDYILKNSFGFGGQNASLVVKMEPGGGVHA